jgi:hypothetical protein
MRVRGRFCPKHFVKIMKRNIFAVTKLFVAGTLALGLVSAALAQTESFTNSISSASSPWGPTSISVQQFNTSLGTLTGIEFTLTGTMVSDMSATNNDSVDRNINHFYTDARLPRPWQVII